jgi:hypothetical protein
MLARVIFDGAGFGNADELAAVNNAFICASRFQHQAIASILLERCVALDKDLGHGSMADRAATPSSGTCARIASTSPPQHPGALGRHHGAGPACVRR